MGSVIGNYNNGKQILVHCLNKFKCKESKNEYEITPKADEAR